jgi:Plasmid replication region DNA-binding N-term
MPRAGITREQVFETADGLVREGQNPTVVSVRARLGGGSPNTITRGRPNSRVISRHFAPAPALARPVGNQLFSDRSVVGL